VAPSAAGGLLGGSGRAKLVWEVLREGRDPFDEGSGLGQNTRAALHAHFSPPAHEMLATSVSECGTRKLLLRLPLGDEVETVIIPHRGFSTLCVSSQVGCRQGCTFCATGTMGLLRSLTADEILLQLHTASAAVREHGMPPLRNVVFMGMGEPADNVEHVTGAPHATPRHDTPHATRRHTTHDAPRGLHASKP
jgi:23S rRNA (adenine2503-C2)-methyltransferase